MNKKILLLIMLAMPLLVLAEAPNQLTPWNFLDLAPRVSDYQDFYKSEMQFYPIEDWEVQACRQDLSTQMAPISGMLVTPPGGVYDITIALSPYVTLDPNGTEHLYEVAWYIQPALNDLAYSIIMSDAYDRNIVDVIKNKQASVVDGDSGYSTLITDKIYTKAIIKYGTNQLPYDIVQKNSS